MASESTLPPQRQADFYWLKLHGLWTVGRRATDHPHIWEVVGYGSLVYEGNRTWDVTTVGPKVEFLGETS